MNCPTISSDFCTRIWNLNLCTILEGGGWWLSQSSFTKSVNDFSVGFCGAGRFCINWYVDPPHTERRIALFVSAASSEIPFAMRYWERCSVYDTQSSWSALNSPILPCLAIQIVFLVAKCEITSKYINDSTWYSNRPTTKLIVQIHHIYSHASYKDTVKDIYNGTM